MILKTSVSLSSNNEENKDQSQNMKTWCMTAEFKLLLFMKSLMAVAPTLQGLSCKVCSVISPTFFGFGLLIPVFGTPPDYTPAACCYAMRTSEIRP